MGMAKFYALLLLASIATCAWSHHHHGYYPEHRKENGHVDFVERASTVDETSEKSTDHITRSELPKRDEKRPDAVDGKDLPPFSARRLEKMLEKAILKIITGDLSTADMLLLKSLNYTFEEILAIREQEFSRRKDEEKTKKLYDSMVIESSSSNDPDVEVSKSERKKNRYKEQASYDDFDFDTYNRQAVIDYENQASNLEQQQSWPEQAVVDYEDESKSSKEQDQSRNLRRNFDRAMEPHVIFKIRYDDSEFDSSSGSNERPRFRDAFVSKDLKHRAPSTLRHTTSKNVASSFHASSSSPSSSSSSSPSSLTVGYTPLPVVYQMRNLRDVKPDFLKNQHSIAMMASPEPNDTVIINTTLNATTSDATTDSMNDSNSSVHDESKKKISEYEGLEWVEDDVYRVIPSLADSLGYEDADENGTSDYEESNLAYLPEENENDTLEYQNDTPVRLFNLNTSMERMPLTNQSARHQMALVHRQNESQKVIEDIKMRILLYTGKLGRKNNTNEVEHEKLTMFSPTCQIPRNTDFEAWTDPFLMNMHFQLNLTASDDIKAAKLRIYKLPQENLTTSMSGDFGQDEVREKKIRISVFYYKKSLKTYRSKRWLMDSVLTPLTAKGGYLVLDVEEGLKFWRPPSRNSHGNGSNHGLVIQVEQQADEKKLKPTLYIQQPSCGDHDLDQKPSAYLPSSFEPVLITFV
ncbi:uncharacterized protein LOC116843898 isoform X2 [Odontomachus brunneus]|uniref:uncharacterized protein LOC116843898 isoform X2 n=1 Tax=Odontomachus brunneus TaxID=486640 RepID=UPI0013F21E97|nr:uncharacterized protein LOC116843898 isoform X2 [Odontomachus brunneus]